MGKIDQPKDSIYQSITDGNQCVGASQGDSGQALLKECCETHKSCPPVFSLKV